MNSKKILVLVGVMALGALLAIGGLKLLENSKTSEAPPVTDKTVSSGAGEAVAADWCAGHRVPESECTKCHPEMIEVFKAKNDWCAEHGLPESHCRQCNPSLTFPQEPPPSSSALQLDVGSEVSVFFPKNKTSCATDGAIVQFASARTAERAGLTIEPAISAEMAPAVEAPAEVVFDETQTTVLTTTVPTLVVRWLAKPGDRVDKGEILAELESPEMPNLKAELLESRAAWSVQEKEQKRMEQMRQKNLISASAFEMSQAAAEETRAHLARAEGLLRSAGLTSEEIEAVAAERLITAKFSLRAWQAGMFMERKVALGNLAPPGTAMAFLSGGGSVWLEAQVREEDLNRVKIGQKVEFVTDAAGFHRGQGNVAWVARFLDPTTRTGKVRVKLRSDGRLLHPGEFGRALIFTQAEKLGTLVPKDAVQWEGCCNVVFVEETPDRYRPRKVQIETADAEHYRVTAGLKPGESVVVKGSYLLKTELKKGSIGAGCCAPEPTS